MEVKFKNFCNRHIMLELPTIKTDFLFEKSQDFNQTTHARPQHPIVFIDIISLYFNCTSSVKYLFKWSCHGHIMPFSAAQTQTQKIEYAYFERREKCLCIARNAVFFYSFQFSKWRLAVGMMQIPKNQIRKYFVCYFILQLF